ncbi:MAG: PQQ-like beta-propeller repeat protein, partial [Planctomycetia bacterium]|nr:PQQ-like beta-propeller repeat protein [Planctomycetia bacterium]
MRTIKMLPLFVCAFVPLVFSPRPSLADDWPQWLGPNRDSVWRESGIVDRFPPEGLPIKWRAPVALGYSGPAVANGRVYVMDYVLRSGTVTNNADGRDRLEGDERVMCLDAATGQLIWKHEYDRPYHISYPGPRCTPAIDGDRVYALGAEGNLSCLDAIGGRAIWSKDFAKDYGARTPYWGVAAQPLVHGNALYCVVGGKGSVAVAFDKRTGAELWRALSASEPGYRPPTMIEHADRKQLLIWHAESLNSLDPETGKDLWSVPLKPHGGMAIAAPRKLGPHLLATGDSNTAVLLKLGDALAVPEILWRGEVKSAVYCTNSTPFLENRMIYGCDARSGALMGVRLEDGERLWQTFAPTIGGTRRAQYDTAFLVK